MFKRKYMSEDERNQLVRISINKVSLEGVLEIPEGSSSLVVFAHGSGSSRLSPRNNFVAKVLQDAGIATLLIDLLTQEEDEVYETRFDINLLTKRIGEIIHWLQKQPKTKNISIGLFGASTGAAGALKAAANLKSKIKAIVSRGGRPDLAMDVLDRVISPTLLIVGGNDFEVIELNQQAFEKIKSVKKMEIVPSATHLFEEPGALEEVAKLATNWFKKYLTKKPSKQ